MSTVFRGIPASPGIVVGPAHLLRWEVPDVPNRIVPDDQIVHELQRLDAAFTRARERLELVRARAERQAGPDEAAIFDVQLTILADADMRAEIEGLVRQNLGAEKAVDLIRGVRRAPARSPADTECEPATVPTHRDTVPASCASHDAIQLEETRHVVA